MDAVDELANRVAAEYSATVVKDSGVRESFASGMQRDTAKGKLRPDLVKDGPMYLRWILHLTRGAVKYAARNWMKATGQAEYDRFLESSDRHYNCWFFWRRYGLNIERLEEGIITREPLTEDHAAGLFFNVNGVEYTADQMAIPAPCGVDAPGPPSVDAVLAAWGECRNTIGQNAADKVWFSISRVCTAHDLAYELRGPMIEALNKATAAA